ncbi:MAG: NUDIX domain-containing protein [Treponema sp.]|jgi:8-oxo-dGTP diphosphatase|nr:NUDIX domain-containing protein [Treponema sp.]
MAELQKRESVAGVAVKGDKLFVARRRPGGDLGGKWEFPGGKARPGESHADTLKREYLEELSVPVEAGEKIGEAEFVHGNTRFFLSALLVTLQSEDFSLKEHSEYRWVTVEELERLDFADSDRLIFPAIRKLIQNTRT